MDGGGTRGDHSGLPLWTPRCATGTTASCSCNWRALVAFIAERERRNGKGKSREHQRTWTCWRVQLKREQETDQPTSGRRHVQITEDGCKN
eukprot:6293444-Karenia_brevis.AAC.1